MLKNLFKFSFAIILCTWLVQNKKLDLSLVSEAFQLGHLWPFGLFLLSTRLLFSALRFKILIDTKTSEPIHYLKILSIDAISSLFSIIIPAGDLVRFLYYKNLKTKLSSGMLLALLTLDRIIGLMGLVGLVSFISLMRFNKLLEISPELKSLMALNALIFSGTCIFMLFFFSKWFPKKKLISIFTSLIPNSPKIQKIFMDILEVNLSIGQFTKCFFLGLLSHAVILGSFLLFIISFLPNNASIYNIITVLPIGIIGSTLPISPSGLGVGHILFDNLFKLVKINNGASLYNLYYVGNVLVCLLGLIPYLFQRNKITPSKIG